jgi:hypothetical protein
VKHSARLFVFAFMATFLAGSHADAFSGTGTAGIARPGDVTAGSGRVSVCVQLGISLKYDVLLRAQMTASAIFDRIGVQVRWSCGASGNSPDPSTLAVLVAFRDSIPADPTRALGYALPFAREGVRATVLYDRCRPILSGEPSATSLVLGHVLAHELGHVLLGGNWHAETGLMRAHWTAADLAAMGVSPLEFTPEDARAIRARVGLLKVEGAPALILNRQWSQGEPAVGLLHSEK